jgi:hypothetical protein
MGKQRSKPNYRRRVLRLPDLDHCKLAVLNSLGSPASRRVYEYAINQFVAWYCSEPRLALNRIVVVRYRMHLESRGLAANTINQQLAAVRRLAHEAADSGLLSPELAAGISRVLRALDEPSLLEEAKKPTLQSYRFTWLRTFHHPVAVRLDIMSDGTGKLTVKIANGAGGYKPGKLIENTSLSLTPEQTVKFLEQIKKTEFWETIEL